MNQRLFAVACLLVALCAWRPVFAADWQQYGQDGYGFTGHNGLIAMCSTAGKPGDSGVTCNQYTRPLTSAAYCVAGWPEAYQVLPVACWWMNPALPDPAPNPDPSSCGYTICVPDAVEMNWSVIGVWLAIFAVRMIAQGART